MYSPSLFPILYVVVPCYNEEAVLPVTAPLFLDELKKLVTEGLVSADSRLVFVDDGSADKTRELIKSLSAKDNRVLGLRQSRNRGHQNALYAGLMESVTGGGKRKCDIVISADCDGQDDIAAMEEMVRAYRDGNEVVYGVRSARETDTFFKRTTAQAFYKLLNMLGAEVVYNHADYRLVSARVLKAFSGFREVNLFLRGMFPLVGFKSTKIYYERHERMAGTSKYPLKKMLALACEGITSLSVKPLRLIALTGALVSALSFLVGIWAVCTKLLGSHVISGWASMTCILCFISGVQLVSLGIVGEYIGKIYLETKGRPRYILSDSCGKEFDDVAA